MHRCAITIAKLINLPSSALALYLELEFSIDIELHALASIAKRTRIARRLPHFIRNGM